MPDRSKILYIIKNTNNKRGNSDGVLSDMKCMQMPYSQSFMNITEVLKVSQYVCYIQFCPGYLFHLSCPFYYFFFQSHQNVVHRASTCIPHCK